MPWQELSTLCPASDFQWPFRVCQPPLCLRRLPSTRHWCLVLPRVQAKSGPLLGWYPLLTTTKGETDDLLVFPCSCVQLSQKVILTFAKGCKEVVCVELLKRHLILFTSSMFTAAQVWQTFRCGHISLGSYRCICRSFASVNQKSSVSTILNCSDVFWCSPKS